MRWFSSNYFVFLIAPFLKGKKQYPVYLSGCVWAPPLTPSLLAFPTAVLSYCFYHMLLYSYMISFLLMTVTPLLVGKKKPSLKLLPDNFGLWFEARHRLRWELYQIVNQLQGWVSPSIFFIGHMLIFCFFFFISSTLFFSFYCPTSST